MKKYAVYILLAVILYFPLFLHLGHLTIRVWDEGRVSMNSFAMLENKNYLVTYFFTEPDMWNLKPPLLNWLQNICFHITGVNELSIRLPLAIAAFLTCLSLFVLFTKYLRSPWIGFLAAIILVSVPGYVSIHGTRTGDYDSLLTLFITLYCLSLYLYCDTGNSRYIYYTCIFVTLACFTKSIAGISFLPGLFVYAIARGKLLPLLKDKATWIGIALFLTVMAGFYFLRDHYNPGYIKAVFGDDLLMLASKTEDHNEKWNFYLDNIISRRRFYYWIWFLPIGYLSVFFQKDERIKRLHAFVIWMSLAFLGFISIPLYKCVWYDLPVFPLLATITAIGIYTVLDALVKLLKADKWKSALMTVSFIIIYIYPYSAIIDFVYKPKDETNMHGHYTVSYFIRDHLKTPEIFNDQVFLFGEHNDHTYFYIRLLQRAGSNVTIWNCYDPLPPNTKVFLFGEKAKEFIKKNYEYTIDNVVENIEFMTLLKYTPAN